MKNHLEHSEHSDYGDYSEYSEPIQGINQLYSRKANEYRFFHTDKAIYTRYQAKPPSPIAICIRLKIKNITLE